MHFELRGTLDMMRKFLYRPLFNHGLLRRLIYSVLEGERKPRQIGLAMGVTIGGDAAKGGKNAHLLVIIAR